MGPSLLVGTIACNPLNIFMQSFKIYTHDLLPNIKEAGCVRARDIEIKLDVDNRVVVRRERDGRKKKNQELAVEGKVLDKEIK